VHPWGSGRVFQNFADPDLENWTDVYFVREPRVVRLTTAGEVLLAHARDVLDRWDVGVAAVNEVADQARRVLVVGIQTGVGRDLQRRTLAGFAERQPEWRLSLRLCPWDDPTAGLTDGTSDVSFVWLPTPDDSELVTTVLYREPRWIALPDDHPPRRLPNLCRRSRASPARRHTRPVS
jgi:DNA-binding transcriptional LysR family regulator